MIVSKHQIGYLASGTDYLYPVLLAESRDNLELVIKKLRVQREPYIDFLPF